MLEYWKDGILGFGKLGFWFIGKIHLDMGGNMLRNENSPLKSTFHYSTIPLFHVRGKNIGPQKISLISASCTISETFN